MTSFCQLKGGGRVWALGDSGGSLSFVSSMLAPPWSLLSQLSLLIIPPKRLFLQQYFFSSSELGSNSDSPIPPSAGIAATQHAGWPLTTLGEISWFSVGPLRCNSIGFQWQHDQNLYILPLFVRLKPTVDPVLKASPVNGGWPPWVGGRCLGPLIHILYLVCTHPVPLVYTGCSCQGSQQVPSLCRWSTRGGLFGLVWLNPILSTSLSDQVSGIHIFVEH